MAKWEEVLLSCSHGAGSQDARLLMALLEASPLSGGLQDEHCIGTLSSLARSVPLVPEGLASARGPRSARGKSIEQ